MDWPVVAEFDWDAGNREKCRKHGVTIEEIEALFGCRPLISPDVVHSVAEERFIAIGVEDVPRPLFVAFTVRYIDGQRAIRPISARYIHRKKVDDHA